MNNAIVRRNFPFTLKWRVADGNFGRSTSAAQETDDAGEIDASPAAVDKLLVDRGGSGAERRGGARFARGGLRQVQVLQHHGGGKSGLVIAVGGRGRYRSRHWAVVRYRPALPRRLRGNVEQLLRLEPELLGQQEALAHRDH